MTQSYGSNLHPICWVSWDLKRNSRLHVEIGKGEHLRLDGVLARFDDISHQHRKGFFGEVGVADLPTYRAGQGRQPRTARWRAAPALTRAQPWTNVAAFFSVGGRSAPRVPMMAWAATFAIRIEGDSMTGAGIFPGDIAVVDRAREPVNGSIVLALLDGAFTVKRYRVKEGAVWLQAENPAFPDIAVRDGQSFEVWGVITRSIRML